MPKKTTKHSAPLLPEIPDEDNFEMNRIVIEHLEDDIYQLGFRSNWYQNYDKTYLINQIQSRQKAKVKLPGWYNNPELIFPAPLSVEQASSELTAAYKASLIAGEKLIDLTGGMGIDSLAFSKKAGQVIVYEQNEELAKITHHNLRKLAHNISVIHGDGTRLIRTQEKVNWIYLDPARRKGIEKVFLLKDCEPDITTILPLLKEKADAIMMKLSPMLDISLLKKEVGDIAEIHVVAVHNEVKELIAIMYPGRKTSSGIYCISIENEKKNSNATFNFDDLKEEAVYTDTVKKYLYEPHPVIMKAGVMNCYNNRFSLQKLHPNSQLFTSGQLIHDYFGRVFEVISVFGLGKHEIKQNLAGIVKANITTRNFPMQEKELRKRLHLDEGGEVYLFATTLIQGEKVLIKCKKILFA